MAREPARERTSSRSPTGQSQPTIDCCHEHHRQRAQATMNFEITAAQDAAIRAIPRFGTSEYGNIDIAGALDFMYKRYVVPLTTDPNSLCSVLCDCGAGFGWLSFAFLLGGGQRAIICEYEFERLAAAKRIAGILGLSQQCEFICCSLHQMPLRDHSVENFASVETLEHVGSSRIKDSVLEVTRVARHRILLSSPNQLFPIDMHDTRLPFTHWLPERFKHRYARSLGRDRSSFNDFPRPSDLRPLHRDFYPLSHCYGFTSWAEWRKQYPHYNPYDKVVRGSPSRSLDWLLSVTSRLFGCYSFIVTPNLCCVWGRRNRLIA